MMSFGLRGRSVRLSRPRRVRLHCETLEGRCVPASVFWAVDASGLWNDANNWVDDQGVHRVPGFNDDVYLDRDAGPFTVTFAQGSDTVSSLHASTSALTISGGTLDTRFSSELDSSLTLSGGTLASEGPFALYGDTQWTGGTIDRDGPLVNYGTMTLSGSDAKLLSGTLTNFGTIAHTGRGDLQVGAFAHLNNQDGALYDLQADVNVVGQGGFTGQFNNVGTLLKSGGAGTSLASAVNNQGGTIDVESGTIGLGRAGKTHTGGYFHVTAGATLDLTSGSNSDHFSGGYYGDGDGTVLLAGGAFNVGSDGAAIDFADGLFQWTGGRIEAGGNPGLTNYGVITLSGSATKDLRGTLTNYGAFVQTGAGTFVLPAFATFKNQDGALYDLQTDANILGEGAFNGEFDNTGVFVKSGGTGTSQFVTNFLNQGGVLEVDTGTLAFTRDVVQQSGTIYLVGGNLGVATLDIQGGTLSGGGTITGNVRNAGTIEVGGPGAAGTLSIVGNFQQTAAGVLNMELGDNDSGEWDYVAVTGSATLGGTLNVSLLDDFHARLNDGFELLNFASRSGNFATVNLPDIGPNLVLQTVFDSTGYGVVTSSPN